MTNLDLADIIGITIGFINKLIPILVTLILVFFIWTGVRYMMTAGEGGSSERGAIIWSMVGLFVVVSIWGILQVLCMTFLQTGTCR